ncbi:DUF418 domain-containing protein [Cellulomonas endophytica]|uniref:DUF418 domain-containing protein n=1 Tax=Cellulomonas endophytica TaxID=2494735 RepID=UPI0010124488|nr:DUF418 domain-containing protein [Cellulomonas endophytica]
MRPSRRRDHTPRDDQSPTVEAPGSPRSSPTSNAAEAAPAPASPGRLLAIDAARGLALVGMVVVNVGPLSVEGLWQRLYLLPYGRASVLFVVIAGIGMAFFVRARRTPNGRWRALIWRAAVLLIGGLLLQRTTEDVGVILPVYGVLFISVLVLQFLPPPVLLGAAAVLAVVGPVLFISHGLDDVGQHLGPPARLGDPWPEIAHALLLSGRYPLVTWAVPFLVGMWAGHLDHTRVTTVRRLIAWGGALAVLAQGASQLSRALLGERADQGYWRLLTGTAHGQMPLWLIGSVGGALFTVAVLLRWWPLVGRWARPLVMAGQMALTLYVLHVLVLAMLRPPEDITIATGALLSAALVTGCLVVAVLWRATASIGPLEWVLRASFLTGAARTRVPAAPVPLPEAQIKDQHP